MVKVQKDLTNMVFGRLTVLHQAEDHISCSGKHRSAWFCKCECGNYLTIIGCLLTRKKQPTRSCGCLKDEVNYIVHKKYNKYEIDLEDEYGKYGIGWTSNTYQIFYFDMDDYDLIKDYCWYEWINPKTGYHSLTTNCTKSSRMLKMTTLLNKQRYDHIDRNPLNNRKYNLRPATILENTRNRTISKQNTSGVIGVGWYSPQNCWQARITVNKKLIRLGFFENKKDAIVARLQAEKKYFGDFAPQKHLYEKYGVTM